MTSQNKGGKPGRRLSNATRMQRISEALERIKNGATVSSRDMKNLLSPDQFQRYEDMLAVEEALRNDAKEASRIFANYIKAVRKGDLLYGKCQSAVGPAKDKFSDQSDAAYERAIEILDDTIDIHPTAMRHLDGYFAPSDKRRGAEYTLDKMRMPRVKYSAQRPTALPGERVFSSKSDIKRRALDYALYELEDLEPERPLTEEEIAAQKALAKQLIAGLQAERNGFLSRQRKASSKK